MKSLLLLLAVAASASATDADPRALARSIAAKQNQPTTVIRMRLESPATGAVQIQARERREGGTRTLLYRILWPKDRAGEAVLIRDGKAQGVDAAGNIRAIPDLSSGLFGSDLALADLAENFFAWPDQKIVGRETVRGVECVILESRPGSRNASIYSAVRSWVDPKRDVPMVIEKLGDNGRPVRRIESTRIVPTSFGHVPADLSVASLGRSSQTRIVGSSIRHDVPIPASELTLESSERETSGGTRE